MPRASSRGSAAAPPAGAPVAKVGETVEVRVERTVAGGAGLAREPGGRVVLIDGALPGETVQATITRSKPRMAEADLARVQVESPGRVSPPCPELLAGCGGCNLQHATPSLQRDLKVGIVRDALARIGRLPDVTVRAGEQLGSDDFRTVLRCAVIDGRVGFHRRRSAELHAIEHCMVAHPLVDEIVETGRFPHADEVTIRVGARTGERSVLVAPTARGVSVPADVLVVGADALAAVDHDTDPGPGGVGPPVAAIHELVARRRFRISPGSFFQARPDGAEALIRAVARAVDPFDPLRDRLVDLYGGVGLFTGGLGARNAVLVERSPWAVADARVNLAELGATVVRSNVRRWTPEAADVVVADPARAGLGADGARAVAATGARCVALVSCDPAALARDARLLVDAGYRVEGVELVDMFPHTHHVEAVTALRRLDVG